MANVGSGAVPRGAVAQPTSQQDYYKSLVPSQLLAERGEEIVVINPGSANVRIGLASAKAPVSVPHCIAHLLRVSGEDAAELPKKGAVGEGWFGTSVLSAARADEREEALELVVSQLKIRSFYSEVKAGGGDSNSCEFLSKERDTGFEWTNVEDISSTARVTSRVHQSSTSKSRPDDPDDVKDGGFKPERSKTYRKYICGEEALKIPASKPYTLYRPMCRGRLNISSKYSMQQVCDDIYRIWDYVLTEKCHIGSKMRPRFSAVLVVPDTLDNREVKELLSVVLRDLQFHSAVVIQECVATTFGNGFSSGCIVNMGAQVITGMCVEEGVAIPSTRFVLPYGGDDITRCLFWVQQRKKTWPITGTDLLRDSLDFKTLEKLKETHCILMEGEQHTTVDVKCRMAGEPTRVYTVLLSSLNVPPMGLFYPSLLALEQFSSLPRPWYHIDHEDTADDTFLEAGRRFETNETGLANGSLNGTSINQDSDPYDFEDKEKKEVEEVSSGLPQAIVKSILSLGRVDLQKKLFASIQLVGGVGLTKGLVDAVEERVLHAIPVDEAVDTVEVLPNRMAPMDTMWKGGAVLAVLDFGRDSWVQYEDWLDGMVMVGSGRKYRDSNTLQAQAFWYNAMLD
ncbi:actin-related protein 9 isoform X2 [Physcomitrium patens]|uniref:Actin-related protein 8 n=1 Tax=Physcomitrium patens TaxID=3218 RepID=A0A2K1KUH6_PHYPA|nr:actin-related protein 9-like isoform X2 [Physcomitrium patens]PNR57442.1 hypothetical protein PHYPA_004436 [Physcomitrium patens]|eukprot:XP_024372201.1 actin-related protein 9-like isoform X2 [Physcomitrella patens]